LRDRDSFRVGELNRAIAPRLQEITAQPFQKLEGSRQRWFETVDRPKPNFYAPALKFGTVSDLIFWPAGGGLLGVRLVGDTSLKARLG
jgi:hypothetical protein